MPVNKNAPVPRFSTGDTVATPTGELGTVQAIQLAPRTGETMYLVLWKRHGEETALEADIRKPPRFKVGERVFYNNKHPCILTGICETRATLEDYQWSYYARFQGYEDNPDGIVLDNEITLAPTSDTGEQESEG